MAITSAAPAKPVNPHRNMLRIGIALMVFGLTIGLSMSGYFLFVTFRALSSENSAVIYTSPSQAGITLGSGRWIVFQTTDYPNKSNPNNAGFLEPSDVKILDPNGDRLGVFYSESSSTVSRDQWHFVPAVAFDISKHATYNISVKTDQPDLYFVARDLGYDAGHAAGWIGYGSLFTGTGIVGLILMLVAQARARRERYRHAFAYRGQWQQPGAMYQQGAPYQQVGPYQQGAPYQQVTPAQQGWQQPTGQLPVAQLPPPGWYPAPHAGNQLRYWDGNTWYQ